MSFHSKDWTSQNVASHQNSSQLHCFHQWRLKTLNRCIQNSFHHWECYITAVSVKCLWQMEVFSVLCWSLGAPTYLCLSLCFRFSPSLTFCYAYMISSGKRWAEGDLRVPSLKWVSFVWCSVLKAADTPFLISAARTELVTQTVRACQGFNYLQGKSVWFKHLPGVVSSLTVLEDRSHLFHPVVR